MSTIVHLSEDLADRLAVEAARRRVSVDELTAELLAAGLPAGEEVDPLEAFIGSGDSGDPTWAGRDTRTLRAEAAARRAASWAARGVLLVDTNVWLAAADRRSERHSACAQVVRAHRGELASTVPVIAESSWLILDRLRAGAQADFMRMVTSGRLRVVDLTGADWSRCVEQVEVYADLRLDLMDASIVAVAERLGVSTVATLNHRDFAVVRPRHLDALELLPWIGSASSAPGGEGPTHSVDRPAVTIQRLQVATS